MTGRLIRQRPITAFLLITFAVSYVLGMPFNMVVSSMLDPSSLVGLYLPRVVMVMGPGVAAVPWWASCAPLWRSPSPASH